MIMMVMDAPKVSTKTFVWISKSGKKQKQVIAAQNIQTDMTSRSRRRSGTGLATTGLLHDSARVILSYPNQEQDNRLVIHGMKICVLW